jgi:hypothetical protein
MTRTDAKRQWPLASKGTRSVLPGLKLQEYAQFNLFSALHNLFKMGVNLKSLQRSINEDFDRYYHDRYHDVGTEPPLLHGFPPNDTPWETCNFVTRATVLYIRKQVESAGSVFPHTNKELYERWTESKSCRHVFVAQIKKEIGVELTSEERQLLIDTAD